MSVHLRNPLLPRSIVSGMSAPQEAPVLRVSDALIASLYDLGVRHAFGVTGGALAPFYDSLGRSPISVVHCRHETGAAFAAAESYFAAGAPSLVFVTSGPGLTNALTGLAAARWEGAKVVCVSACTSPTMRGRGACQETSGYTMPIGGIFTAGTLFHYGLMMETPVEVHQVISRLASGLSSPGGFVGHVAIPTSLQHAQVPTPCGRLVSAAAPTCAGEALDVYARLLAEGSFVVWAGFGARDASAELRAFIERTGAAVMCSPRAKGIFPENHPKFLGVTGLGGYGRVEEYMRARRPDYVLVLGTRLGEPTSYWRPVFIPQRAFLHVDVDPDVPGKAYPNATTYAIQSDVKSLLSGLIERWPKVSRNDFGVTLRSEEAEAPRTSDAPRGPESFIRVREASAPTGWSGPVRPAVLMDAVQRVIVEGSDAVIMAESGNAFAWGNHYLRFEEPGRYRVSVGFGSMGHVAAGVLGVSISLDRKAVAIVGDGSMLMNNEVSTAVSHRAKAVWIVLNDASYGMVEHGMRALGFKATQTAIPRVDFVMLARAMGAEGVRVERETELEAALVQAMEADGPFVVDVWVDPTEPGPWMKRIQALIAQGAKSGGGDEK